ncbi:TPA: hypothetical protein U2I18_003073 [Citrobacter koseri]|nr:hypothetical protein [Citrobacter koseri]
MSNFIWFEKTVEYKFVFSAKEHWGIDLLSPLAGDPEVIGDAIVSSRNRYFIIEFKRNAKSRTSEYEKYKGKKEGFIESVKAMTKNSSWEHHYIIYGSIDSETKDFILKEERYFQYQGISPVPKKPFFEGGMSVSELSEYAQALTACKNGDADGGGSGGQEPSQVNVLALGQDNIGAIIPLDYFQKLKLAAVPTAVQDVEPDNEPVAEDKPQSSYRSKMSP